MSVGQKMGVRPKYTFIARDDGGWLLIVRPIVPGLSVKEVVLTSHEHECIVRWMNGGGMLAHLLPDWTPSQREIILSGINDNEWDKLFKPDN